MKIKNIYFNAYGTGLIFICFGIFFLGLLMYESTNVINKKKKNEKEKFYIINKNQWCNDQEHYLGNKKFYPIKIKSIKNNNKKEEFLYRNGYVMIAENPKANILLCHGFMTSKEDMALFRCLLKDYNIITFDFRAHGENISNQLCTLGCDEKYDVLAAANYIKQDPLLNSFPLFVYGFSMGAVASILAQSENKDLFVGAIWDCPFQSTNDLTDIALQYFKINMNGYKIDLPYKNFIKKYIYNKNAQGYIRFILKLFSSMDSSGVQTCIKKISPIEALQKISIPFLLIGCHNDDKAPPERIVNMYNAHKNNSYVRCWISPGRRHFDALFLNPEKYFYKINKFINDVLTKKYINKKRKKVSIDESSFLMVRKR